MGATQDKGKHGEAAFMVLWRHVGTWVAWRARGRDVWMPGGPSGPRLGPVWAGTGLYSRAPPQPPIYTPSFCILSSSTSFSVTSCMILNFWFWELIQSWGKSTHTLLVWLSKNLGDMYDTTNFVFHFRNLFCLIYKPPTLIKTRLVLFDNADNDDNDDDDDDIEGDKSGYHSDR